MNFWEVEYFALLAVLTASEMFFVLGGADFLEVETLLEWCHLWLGLKEKKLYSDSRVTVKLPYS